MGHNFQVNKTFISVCANAKCGWTIPEHLFQSVQMLNVDGPFQNRLKLKMSLFLKFIEYMQDRSSIYLTSAIHLFSTHLHLAFSINLSIYLTFYLNLFIFYIYLWKYLKLKFTFYMQYLACLFVFNKRQNINNKKWSSQFSVVTNMTRPREGYRKLKYKYFPSTKFDLSKSLKISSQKQKNPRNCRLLVFNDVQCTLKGL